MSTDYKYPHTFELSAKAQTLGFEDGMELVIQANSFTGKYTVTIDKQEPASIEGHPAVTAVYSFDKGEVVVPDPLIPLVSKAPTVVEIEKSTVLGLWLSPVKLPDPTEWIPDPKNAPTFVASYKASASLTKVDTFSVNLGE